MTATRVFHPVARTTFVELRYTHGTNRLLNRFAYWWNNTTPPSIAELTSLCTEVGATIGAKLQAMTVQSVVLIEVHARNMDIVTGNAATAAFTTGTTGALSGQQAPSNAAGNLVTRTGLSGYGQHGAKRFSECDAFSCNGNSFSGTHMGRYASMALSVAANRVSGRFLPVIPHVPRVGTGSSSLITSILMLDSDIDSQKTRLNNHGA